MTMIANLVVMAFDDKYPITEGHMLVSPLRHTPSFFDLGASEQKACLALVGKIKEIIVKKDPKVTGFHIGVHDGADAGQTIMHYHIHLIPRRKEDVENPRGGIRHTIPGKGSY